MKASLFLVAAVGMALPIIAQLLCIFPILEWGMRVRGHSALQAERVGLFWFKMLIGEFGVSSVLMIGITFPTAFPELFR